MQIKSRYTDAVIFEDDKPTLRETVLNAVAQKAYLAGAYLAGADNVSTEVTGEPRKPYVKLSKDREDRLAKQINAICLELTAADEDEIAERIVFDYLWLCVIRDYPDLETAEELASLMADGADVPE